MMEELSKIDFKTAYIDWILVDGVLRPHICDDKGNKIHLPFPSRDWRE